MAMRKSIARELRMLRMVAHFFLPQHTCEFCGKALMPKWNEKAFDTHQPPPVVVQITPHHRDGHPEGNKPGKRNNSQRNIGMVHRTCHKSYELKRRHELNRQRRAA